MAQEAAPLSVAAEAGPFEDYGRVLTPEGGILIWYKDLDLSLYQYVKRAITCSAFTGAEGWYLFSASPVESAWVNLICLLAIAGLNFLIVRKPSECQRRIEIRPDCLIIEGADVFWQRYIDHQWPALQQDDATSFRLCGIYGTRFVEYLTAHRLDEFDRTPEVLAAQLENAFTQLWPDRPSSK